MMKSIQDEKQEVDTRPLTSFKIELEKKRWLILIGYALFSLSNGILRTTFASLTKESKQYFKRTEFSILELSFSSIAVTIVTMTPVMFTASDFLPLHVLLAATCTTLAGWMRFIGGPNYYYTLGSSLLEGLSSSGLYVCLPIIAERWFSVAERLYALIIGCMANYLGGSIGLIYPSFYFTKHSDLESAFKDLFLQQAIIASVPMLILIGVVRNRPKSPPSYSEYVKTHERKYTIKKTIAELWTSKSYVRTAISFGAAFGAAFTLPNTTIHVLKMHKFDGLQIGYLGMDYYGAGFLGAMMAALIIKCKKKSNFDQMIKFMVMFGFFVLLLMAYYSQDSAVPFSALMVLSCTVGIGFISYAPLAIDSLLEMSFPINEALSIGTMYFFSQLAALFFSYITTAEFIGHAGYWVLAGCYFPFAFYAVVSMTTEFKRQSKGNTLLEPPIKLIHAESIDITTKQIDRIIHELSGSDSGDY